MFVDQVKVNGFHAIYVFVALLFGQCGAKHFEHVVQVAMGLVQAAKVGEALGFEIRSHGSALPGALNE